MRVFLAAALLMLAGPAAAAPVEGSYVASWAGLPAGKVQLRIEDDGNVYAARMRIQTEGVPRWFTRFRSDAVSEGRFAADGRMQPSRYDAVYDLRKRKDKRASLRFVPRGDVLVAERGPEDTSKKPPPPEVHRRDVVDPLSALVAVRHVLLFKRVPLGAEFVVPVFDGSRRFDAVAKASRLPGLVRVDLVLQPIAGFKDDKPDEDEDPEDSPRPVTVDFSDDGRWTPLRLEVSIAWFPAVIRLAEGAPQTSSK